MAKVYGTVWLPLPGCRQSVSVLNSWPWCVPQENAVLVVLLAIARVVKALQALQKGQRQVKGRERGLEVRAQLALSPDASCTGSKRTKHSRPSLMA
eukprot:3937408-Amphidinium_carterae.1